MTRRKIDLCCVGGRYRRTIGLWRNAAGRITARRFLLGTDLRQAQRANLQLEQLWELVVADHRQRVSGSMGGLKSPSKETGPLWDRLTLWLAEAIRHGQTKLEVPYYPEEAMGSVDAITGVFGPSAYAQFITYLTEHYAVGLIFIAADRQAFIDGQLQHATVAQHRARLASQSARVAGIAIPEGPGQTLYEALDAYATHQRGLPVTEHHGREADRTTALKRAHPDVLLDQFRYDQLERMAGYWRARPEAGKRGGGGKGRPISVSTVDNMLRTIRRFVRWLDRSSTWRWELPRHAADALRCDLLRLQTPAEIAAEAAGPPVWTREQVRTLIHHATRFERTLLLVGLNCGFSAAEIVTLRRDEVHADGIRRVRHKTRAAGRWPLWSSTREHLKWIGTRHGRVGNPLAVLSKRGRPLTRSRVANIWQTLLARVEKQEPGFPKLPFKHVRKTAGQFIREIAGGEIAGVFLSHRTAVRSDELLDLYTQRPFDKVADAVRTLEQQLDLREALAPRPRVAGKAAPALP